MKAFLIYSLTILLTFAAIPHAKAQEVIIGEEGYSAVTGTVEDIGIGDMRLKIDNDQTITVITENIRIEQDTVEEYFDEGDYIRVYGEISEEEIEAVRIMKIAD